MPKANEKIVNVSATFSMKVIVRNDNHFKNLLENETEFIFEPKSVNGCVLESNITSIKEI